MGDQKPSVGRIVHYRIGEVDAAAITSQRVGARPGSYNVVRADDVYPAVVVRVFDPSVNLQVLLDGTDSYWATSRTEGDGPGHWSWLPRV